MISYKVNVFHAQLDLFSKMINVKVVSSINSSKKTRMTILLLNVTHALRDLSVVTELSAFLAQEELFGRNKGIARLVRMIRFVPLEPNLSLIKRTMK